MAGRSGERRRGGASTVGSVVSALGGSAWDAKIREHLAPLVWAEVVGPQVAGATTVIGVGGGVLKIATVSSVWSHELTFYKADILRRLNARVGTPMGGTRAPVLTDIVFQNQGRQSKEAAGNAPVPPPLAPAPEELDDISLSLAEVETIEAGLSPVTDEGLRARMRRIRIADARLRTWRLDSGWLPCPRCGDLAPPPPPNATMNACTRCRIDRAPAAAAYRADALPEEPDDTPPAARDEETSDDDFDSVPPLLTRPRRLR